MPWRKVASVSGTMSWRSSPSLGPSGYCLSEQNVRFSSPGSGLAASVFGDAATAQWMLGKSATPMVTSRES
jgi:hypothetical protein